MKLTENMVKDLLSALIIIAVLVLIFSVPAHAETVDPDMARCPGVDISFLPQLKKANQWYDAIAHDHGSAVAAHYKWLECGAAHVDDWEKHGSTTRPEDFFGKQGYDSPLGTCNYRTPIQRIYYFCSSAVEALGCSARGALSTKWSLRGGLGDDGKIHGWVRSPHTGDMRLATISDTDCPSGCYAEFEDTCGLALPIVFNPPFKWTGSEGQTFYSWWSGEDASKPSQWEQP